MFVVQLVGGGREQGGQDAYKVEWTGEEQSALENGLASTPVKDFPNPVHRYTTIKAKLKPLHRKTARDIAFRVKWCASSCRLLGFPVAKGFPLLRVSLWLRVSVWQRVRASPICGLPSLGRSGRIGDLGFCRV